ncbi:MAG: hypothetical protein JWN64_500 [Parcubacteria group bacterium]|nr:hypothetical protein [Parcubacteria group bacterium]
MKQLIAGTVLILVLGVAAFFYRNMLERPGQGTATGTGDTACTLEAKICPDGTSVGRTGPNCAFAACVAPNVELASAGIAFALPAGYVKGVQEPGADGFVENMLDFYQKPGASTVPHYISVYSYPISAGKTADAIILENTRYQPSDMQAQDFSRFTSKTINGKTFRSTVIERFEGQVVSAYFLVRANDVLRFEILERDVTNWSDTNLVVENLPEHQALLKMLGTLQTQ